MVAFGSAAEAASDCASNVENYGTILAYYGISCANVANASTLTINSDDWNKQLWSMGRLPYGIAGETPVTIPGLGYPIYARYLWGWDSPGTSSNYQVLNVTTTGGQTFFLMYECGNVASVGFPQPVAQPPNITLSKTTIPGYPEANSTVSPGTTLGYRIYFNNLGGQASNVYVTDAQPTNTTETSMSGGETLASFTNNTAIWYFSTMQGGAMNWYDDLYVKVNANTPNGTQICNVAAIRSTETPLENTNAVCITVQNNSLPPKPTPPPPPKPAPQTGCESQLSSENTSACISIKKSASNLTENISNANGTTAQAGDDIQYTLSATNNGSNSASYIFQDSLAYVLDYSSLVNTGGGTLNSSTNEISWPTVKIAAGKTATKQFEVKVDNPIPDTPTSTSDPNYFNLTMTNTFGNTITIKLPSTPVLAAVQTASASLPNTGPGNSVIIGAIVLAIAGFFFYRSRLIAKEAKIAINEQSGEMLND